MVQREPNKLPLFLRFPELFRLTCRIRGKDVKQWDWGAEHVNGIQRYFHSAICHRIWNFICNKKGLYFLNVRRGGVPTCSQVVNILIFLGFLCHCPSVSCVTTLWH